jgi:hypothetical protein
MIDAEQIERIVSVSDPEVRRILGIENHGDPDQVARRMVRQGVPHLRIGRRIRFSIPVSKHPSHTVTNSDGAAIVRTNMNNADGAGVWYWPLVSKLTSEAQELKQKAIHA